MKSYGGKIRTNFHDNDVPGEGVHYVCLSATLIDSFLISWGTFYTCEPKTQDPDESGSTPKQYHNNHGTEMLCLMLISKQYYVCNVALLITITITFFVINNLS